MVWANFPKVTKVGYGVYGKYESWVGGSFNYCRSLASVSFGTAFEEPTEIEFGSRVFEGYYYDYNCPYPECEKKGFHWHLTDSIELTLGQYVLPKSDGNAWNFKKKRVDLDIPEFGGQIDSVVVVAPYIWKIIHTVGIKELIKNILVTIYPHPATEYTTLSFSLEKPCYLTIDLFDINGKKVKGIYNGFSEVELFTTRFNTGNLANGAYLIKISIGKDFVIKKIIVN